MTDLLAAGEVPPAPRGRRRQGLLQRVRVAPGQSVREAFSALARDKFLRNWKPKPKRFYASIKQEALLSEVVSRKAMNIRTISMCIILHPTEGDKHTCAIYCIHVLRYVRISEDVLHTPDTGGRQTLIRVNANWLSVLFG